MYLCLTYRCVFMYIQKQKRKQFKKKTLDFDKLNTQKKASDIKYS